MHFHWSRVVFLLVILEVCSMNANCNESTTKQTFGSDHFATLSNGHKIPRLGLGTSQVKFGEVETAITAALDIGYLLIDTASVYGNEAEIGNALEKYFKSCNLKREDIFLTTKLWASHNRPEDVELALKESLKKLKTEYVDLYLIHQPISYDHEMKEQDKTVRIEKTWKAMEDVYEKGLTKAIGVSNFNEEQIERILKQSKTPIHCSQVELHLLFQQEKHVDVCHKNNITVTAYAPLGSPGRNKNKLPNEQPTEIVPQPLDQPEVLEIAKNHNKTPAEILLRHLIQKDILVIPKSTNPKRIEENSKVFDFELSNEEMKTLNSVKQGSRYFSQDIAIGHPEDPWKDERPQK